MFCLTFDLGQRVRVKGCPSGLTLRSQDGSIVNHWVIEDWYTVRLDQPAINDDGVDLAEIVEAADNLEVIEE